MIATLRGSSPREVRPCGPFKAKHHCPWVHPATHLAVHKKLAPQDYLQYADRVLWSGPCSLRWSRKAALAAELSCGSSSRNHLESNRRKR